MSAGVQTRLHVPAGPASDGETLGFDLHELVTVGLADADERAIAAVSRQLGMAPAPLRCPPDIVLRFQDELPPASEMRLLGAGDAGYNERDFYLLRGKNNADACVSIPFDRIGGTCEIICNRGLSAVPLLIPIINATILAKGAVAMHASACVYRGTGALITGWAKGGKTEILFSFAAEGAGYVGDEWVYLTGDGRRMFGIPEPMRLWDWHLEQLPRAWSALPLAERAQLRVLRGASRLLGGKNGRALRTGSRWSRAVRRVGRLIDSQRYAHLPPAAAFGRPCGTLAADVDLVIFTASHGQAEVRVEAVAAEEVAARMSLSLQEERMPLMSAYRKFRFAFPHRSNLLLESIADLELERMRNALALKPCIAVYHPYPPSIPDLFSAIRPHLGGLSGRAEARKAEPDGGRP